MKYNIEMYETRYFIGVEKQGGIVLGSEENISELWKEFLEDDMRLLQNVVKPVHFIGLDCYPPDFGVEKQFDYYAMVEVDSLQKQPGFTLKKLPAGKYMVFELMNEQIQDQIRKVYQYVKKENIKVHMGFDYEDFLDTNNIFDKTKTIKFALLLNE